MKCLRCGYCCKQLLVTIVDDPEKPPTKDNLVVYEGDGSGCKHLRGFEPGKHWCAVHDKEWYKHTPCYRHNQIERNPDEPCRVGKRVLGRIRELEIKYGAKKKEI